MKPSPDTIALLDKARLELNLALTAKVEKQINWNNNRFYTQGDKMGSMLAAKLNFTICQR